MENKYDIRINRALYGRLVPPKNYVEKLNVQCAESSMAEIPTNSDLYGQSDEIYQYNCSKKTLSSLNIRCGYKTLKFDVSGIQYSMDKAVYSTGGNTSIITPVVAADNNTIGIFADNNLGIASPLNFMVLASDPINMLANSTVKVDNFESKTQISDSQLDFYNRMFDADELRHSENFLMLPDETSSYNYNNKKALYSENKKVFLSGIAAASVQPDAANGNTFDFAQAISKCTVAGYLDVAEQTDLQKLKYDKMNSLGLLNRGQMMIDSDPKNLIFSKAIASPNYTYNGTDQTFVATAPTTTLFTIKYGNNYYPSNISQADYEASGIQLCHAIFFYDKNNSLAFFRFRGFPNGTNTLATEPIGQSLSMTFQYNNVEGSILNDITTRLHDNNVISNITGITITRNLRSDPAAILKCLLPYESILNGQIHQNTNLSIVPANYPVMKGLTINVNRIGGYIKIQQYSAPARLHMPLISSHPYIKREQTTEDISKVLLGGNTWASNCAGGKVLPYELNSKNFTMVPKAVALWVNVRNQNIEKNRHGSTNRRAIITNYQLRVGQQPYLFSERSRKQWFDIGKQNGLKNYEYTGFCENKFVETYNPKTNSFGVTSGTGNVSVIDNFNIQSIIKTNSHTDTTCAGNFIFYSFDDNVPLPEGYSSSTSQFNQNLQHKFELYCDDADSTFAEVNVVYFYDKQMMCDSNSAVSVVDQTLYFTPEQVITALNKVNSNVDNDEYTSKYSNVGYGSGLFHSTLDKIKSKLPSLHRVKELVVRSEPTVGKSEPIVERRVVGSEAGGATSRPRTMRDFFKQ